MENNHHNPKRKIYVSIGGMSYQLVSDRSEEYIHHIARKADEAVRRVRTSKPSLSDTQVVVLALVNILDAHEASFEQFVKVKAELLSVREENARVVEERDLHRDTSFEFKKELLRISELNRHLELEIAALRAGGGEFISERQTQETAIIKENEIIIDNEEAEEKAEDEDKNEDEDENENEGLNLLSEKKTKGFEPESDQIFETPDFLTEPEGETTTEPKGQIATELKGETPARPEQRTLEDYLDS
jgi:cell division protein ZapA (FtsZ GTPase activity inhibitor)